MRDAYGNALKQHTEQSHTKSGRLEPGTEKESLDVSSIPKAPLFDRRTFFCLVHSRVFFDQLPFVFGYETLFITLNCSPVQVIYNR